MNNREIICIHVGQAGIQIGSAVWELLSIEHELDPSGRQICYCPWPLTDITNSLFFGVGKCKFKPRSLMVDSECLVLDEIRTGSWSQIFESKSLINGKEDAATIFAKGYNSCATEVLDESLSYLRQLIEECNSLNGFLLFHSLGGGTGSGLTSRLVESIQSEVPQIPFIHLTIIPSRNLGFVVEPYNGVLSTAALLESSTLMILLENEALYKTSEILTNNKKISFIDINRHISRITSSLTSSYRFKNKLSSDFSVFQTNLVPYPEIHFPIASYCQSNESTDNNLIPITKSCFNRDYMTLEINPDLGYFMSCCMLYRGMDCSLTGINYALQTIKSDPKIKFVDWSPTSFKVAINVEMPGSIPNTNIPETSQSLCVLSNSTAVIQAWINLLENFQSLFSRKAFLHWFVVEGIDEEMLKSAEERIVNIVSQYKDLETDKDITYLNKKKDPDKMPHFLKKVNFTDQQNKDIPQKNSKPQSSNNDNLFKKKFNEFKLESYEETRSYEKEYSGNINEELKTESTTTPSVSFAQKNVSSKYKTVNGNIPSNSLRIKSNLSQIDSIFMDFFQKYLLSSKAPDNNRESSDFPMIPISKLQSFSVILKEKILNSSRESHLKKIDSSIILNSRVFLSQFCSLNSTIINSNLQRISSSCSFASEKCILDNENDAVTHDSVVLKETFHIFDESININDIKSVYQPTLKATITLSTPVFISTSVEISNEPFIHSQCEKQIIGQLPRHPIKIKHYLRNKLSRMCFRRPKLCIPNKSKSDFHKKKDISTFAKKW